MGIFEAIILGIVQGLTEFLPVSSSGHLIIGTALFGLNGEKNLSFAIVVHAATVMSTIVILWSEIWQLLQGLFKFRWNEETQYIGKIFLSMLPVLIVGLFFKDTVDRLFEGRLLLVGCCLLVTAVLLSFAYFAKPRQKENIGWWSAFLIGVSQAIAVLPGLSRSGTTISTGLLLGHKKENVAKFSFLMVLIPILGKAVLNAKEMMHNPTEAGIGILPLVAGFVAAFATGCFACKFMINIVKKGKLIYFAVYCAIVGVLAILGNAFFL